MIAVRYENMLFGNYYHGGTTSVVDATGTVLSSEIYPTTVPSDEGTHGVYTLTTVAPDALTTNFRGTQEGSLRLTLDGANVTVASTDASQPVEDLGSSFNRARLLQNRKIFLHYRYANGLRENILPEGRFYIPGDKFQAPKDGTMRELFTFA